MSESLALPRGLNQGFPLLGIMFQFYNADMVDGCNGGNGEEIVAFMDDALMLAKVEHEGHADDDQMGRRVGLVMHPPM